MRKHYINREITTEKVSLVSESGLISMKTAEALTLAENDNLDLVCLSKLEGEPTCKIFDYKKFLFEEKKKNKLNKSKKLTLKEVKFSMKISSNDISYRLTRIENFLNDGSLVKLTITMKGRELNNKQEAKKLLETIMKNFKDIKVEKPPKSEGRNFTSTIKREL